MSKPNCYDCKYRGSVPGSAHSSCHHPNNKELLENPLLGMLSIFANVRRVPAIQGETGLNVIGNNHGISKGWFNWPCNFDPTWLERCDGFEKKPPKTDE